MVGVAKTFLDANPLEANAGDGADNYPLGSWSNGAFTFKSASAEQKWREDALQSGVHFQAWDKGAKLSDKTRQLVELGFAPSDDIYRGPDGDYYQITPAARPDMRAPILRASASKSGRDESGVGEALRGASKVVAPTALASPVTQASIPAPIYMRQVVANDNSTKPLGEVESDNNTTLRNIALRPHSLDAKQPDVTRPRIEHSIGLWDRLFGRGKIEGCPTPNCDEVRRDCENGCKDLYISDPSQLSGSGQDMKGRYRRRVRECMEAHGCFDY
jgi:hypothetical protein